MKKINHVKVLFLLLFLYCGNTLYASVEFIDPKIIKTNWVTPMYPFLQVPIETPQLFCLDIMAPDYNLKFNVKVMTAADVNLNNFPALHIAYNFNGVSGVTPALNIADAIQDNYKEEYLNEWTIPFNFNVFNNCAGQSLVPYHLSYSLVTLNPTGGQGSSYIPYPTQDYPDLFPTSVFGTNPPSNSVEKSLCCPHESLIYNDTNESLNMINGKTEKEATQDVEELVKNNIEVFPNPFQETINIKYEVTQSTKMTLSLLNINGKQIKSSTQEFDTKGNYPINLEDDDIPIGLYFLRVHSKDFTKTYKLVKIK